MNSVHTTFPIFLDSWIGIMSKVYLRFVKLFQCSEPWFWNIACTWSTVSAWLQLVHVHVWEPRVVTPIQLSLKSAMNLWNFYIFIRHRMRIDFWVADCQVYNGFPWTPHLKMWEKKKVTFQVSSNARLWPLGCTFLNDQITGKRNVLLPWCNYSVLKAPSVTIITASFTECYATR